MDKYYYVDKRIEELNDVRHSLIDKSIFNGIVGGFGTIFNIVIGTLLYAIIPEISVPFFLIGSLIPTAMITNFLPRKYQMKMYNDEISHLSAMKKVGINAGKGIDKKRLDRINDYEMEQDSISNKEFIYNGVSIVGGVSYIISSIVSMVNPSYLVFSGISYLILNGFGIKSASLDKRVFDLETKINNLKHNIEFSSICDKKSKMININDSNNKYYDKIIVNSVQNDYQYNKETIEKEKPKVYVKTRRNDYE